MKWRTTFYYKEFYLLTLGDRVRLGPELLADGAHLSWPLAALLISHVATLSQLTLLLVLSPETYSVLKYF